MNISVIIPALNEAERIRDTLLAIGAQAPPFEMIVVDGGSEDETVLQASEMARVVSSDPGRATQMNRGAEEAIGDVLLFLHADTHLPPQGLDAIRSALSDPSAEAGAFRLAFDHWTPLLRFYSYCTRFSLPSLCFGDRGLFIRKSVFKEMGGFAPVPLFEDLDMTRRLYARGSFRFLPEYVTTAARRFEQNGPFRQQLRNAYLWLHFLRGTDPVTLAHHYTYTDADR